MVYPSGCRGAVFLMSIIFRFPNTLRKGRRWVAKGGWGVPPIVSLWFASGSANHIAAAFALYCEQWRRPREAGSANMSEHARADTFVELNLRSGMRPGRPGDFQRARFKSGECARIEKNNRSPWLPIVFDLKFSPTPDRLLSSRDRG